MSIGFTSGLTLSMSSKGGGSSGTPWAIPALFTSGTLFPVLLTGTTAPFGSTYVQSDWEGTGTTRYVRTTGNDATGDGTLGNPYRQIQAAITASTTGDKIDVGSGRFTNFTLATKNISIYGVKDATFVGAMLTEAQITWGAFASNRQTATLGAGSFSGFVDLTIQQRGHYQVAVISAATSAALIATQQALGNAAVFRSTPSSVGASDLRNLSGSADTDIIAWSSTAAGPFVLSSSAQLFVKNISFVGGARCSVPTGTRLVADNCSWLGGYDYNVSNVGATTIYYQCRLTGSGVSAQNMADYQAASGISSVGVEIDCIMDQSSLTGADNCSTCHGSVMLRINGSYTESSKPIHDVGPTTSGIFGATVAGKTSNIACGTSNSSTEMHFKNITFVAGTPVQGIEINGSPSTMYFYDTSYVGQTFGGVAGSANLVDRSGVKPTSDTTLFELDPSNIATLFQDTAATVPVTTTGQSVLRINDASGSGAYVTVTSGTLTYNASGGKFWAASTGAANSLRMAMNSVSTAFADASNIVIGTVSSDTTWILMASTVQDYYGRFGSATLLYNVHATSLGSKEAHVDGGPTIYTNGSTLATAASGGAAHVVTYKNINVSWVGWRVADMFNSFGGSTFGFDGNLYGLQISRATNDTNLRAREQAMATKCGATLV